MGYGRLWEGHHSLAEQRTNKSVGVMGIETIDNSIIVDNKLFGIHTCLYRQRCIVVIVDLVVKRAGNVSVRAWSFEFKYGRERQAWLHYSVRLSALIAVVPSRDGKVGITDGAARAELTAPSTELVPNWKQFIGLSAGVPHPANQIAIRNPGSPKTSTAGAPRGVTFAVPPVQRFSFPVQSCQK